VKKLNVGYSFWGFLGDRRIKNGKEISAPDGNATYSYTIIHELTKRGHQVFSMMPKRDKEAVNLFGKNHFNAFSQDIRWNAYNNFKDTFLAKTSFHGPYVERTFPDLDILLVEWRFPIPGRNCEIDITSSLFQADLHFQTIMLQEYRENHKNTKIIILDLDHKLTKEDEERWQPDAIFETSFFPKKQLIERTSVYIPTIIDELLQFPTKPITEETRPSLVYVGSRYERDEVIDKYIKLLPNYEIDVHFYGNWLDYPDKLEEAKIKWPKVQYHGRIGCADFHKAYEDASYVPLLGKQSYFDTGFVTARIFEAVLFGSIPIAFSEHVGIENLAVKIVNDWIELGRETIGMALENTQTRDKLRKEQAAMLRPMDVSNFVNKMLEVL
jgi:hypothetical protein